MLNLFNKLFKSDEDIVSYINYIFIHYPAKYELNLTRLNYTIYLIEWSLFCKYKKEIHIDWNYGGEYIYSYGSQVHHILDKYFWKEN